MMEEVLQTFEWCIQGAFWMWIIALTWWGWCFWCYLVDRMRAHQEPPPRADGNSQRPAPVMGRSSSMISMA